MASYVIASHYIVESVQVQGPSMAPTIADSDYYLLDHLTYLWRVPQRGDVVVIRDPMDGCKAIKRIIAIPGEFLFLKGGRVYLNGNELIEPYLPHGTRTHAFSASKQQVIKCRKDEYAVLGDNRGDSLDSRLYGSIAREDILGLVNR